MDSPDPSVSLMLLPLHNSRTVGSTTNAPCPRLKAHAATPTLATPIFQLQEAHGLTYTANLTSFGSKRRDAATYPTCRPTATSRPGEAGYYDTLDTSGGNRGENLQITHWRTVLQGRETFLCSVS
jgi:hypothetical protein